MSEYFFIFADDAELPMAIWIAVISACRKSPCSLIVSSISILLRKVAMNRREGFGLPSACAA